ncbi:MULTISPECIES: hypothetical protein [unclassified Carboxylicivirga]|uniref:hypothetical protein n=1 Tax=Carboxylicivirga TaxID=1628153 RepID=UPI003D34CAFD
MNNGIAKIIIIFIIGFFVLKTCNNRSDNRSDRRMQERSVAMSSWEKSPVDELIKKYSSEQNFSIILQDMDARDNKYYHQYNVLVEHPDTVLHEETGWETVSDQFFAAHVNNMGMEIVSKKDGKVSKQASPAGYNHYIGNERYGRWTERNGTSFWEFYGQYAFMSSMFNLMAYPARRSYYDDYYRGGYYGSRPYYGPSGRGAVYGTKNYTASGTGKNSTWASKPSSFKQNVRSQVARSSQAGSSRSYSSGSSYSNRNSRSSSRYSRSSSRSRSGGFGK